MLFGSFVESGKRCRRSFYVQRRCRPNPGVDLLSEMYRRPLVSSWPSLRIHLSDSLPSKEMLSPVERTRNVAMPDSPWDFKGASPWLSIAVCSTANKRHYRKLVFRLSLR